VTDADLPRRILLILWVAGNTAAFGPPVGLLWGAGVLLQEYIDRIEARCETGDKSPR
jgi:hypothetical protein